ncbi:MAG: efflux RND transporter permease subunit [Acidobacteriota bacterium]|nr:MAG: efflux RND transporter permease subunit [Acidobacteriota bacterium]
MRIADIPIDRPVATLMLLLSLMVLGAVAVFRLPLDFMPMVAEPEVDVEVPFPGSHPLEALKQVAMPIEEELATIPEVRSITSRVNAGSANIETRFDWSVDIDIKKMEVREAVERVRPSLPDGLGHIRVEGDIDGPGGGAILHGRISAQRSLSESWDLLDRRIRRPLERVRGVARVNLYGVEPQQVRIELDLDALKRHGINAGEVMSRIDAANLDMDLGTIRGDVLRYDVRTESRFQDVSQLRALDLGPEGLRLADVARVVQEEPRLDYGRHLDRKFAIGIDVFKEPTANTVDTITRLMERIEEVQRDPELEGVRLLVWNNAGEEILNSLTGLRNAGIFGGFLAVAVLFVFLRRVRTTLVVAVAIPFSLLVTCGAMYLLGAQFNVLTLLGLMLGVGMLVDNAVVVMENIHRRQAHGFDPKQAARIGTSEVFLAVLASTATTIIVWSWLFVSDRDHLTIYMGEVAMTICLAVVCSLLISVTFIPLAATYFVPRKKVQPGFLLTRVVPAYRHLLGWTLRHRFITLIGLLALATSAAYPIIKIEKRGDPKFRESQVGISYEIHDPATKEVLEGYVDQVEAWLESRKEELGYENVYSWFSENSGTVTIVYLPREQASEESIARLRKQLGEDLPVIPGVKLSVGEREWWRHGRQGRRMVAISIQGDDPEYLQTLAQQVEERMIDLSDVVEVYGPSISGQKEVRVLLDPDKVRALELTPQLIADVVAFAYRGRHLRRFKGERGELEVVVELPEDAQPGLASLNDLPIPRQDGATVPLASVAEVTIARTPPHIRREDRETSLVVSVQFDESITTEEAKQRVSERMAGFTLPEGYSWDFGLWGRYRDEGLGQMLNGVLLALAVVLLLMAALFESLTQPLAILITLPLAFFGAFWMLWLTGYELDAVAFMGVVILIGIVVNNGIVMVDHVNALRRAGKPRSEALLEGCGDRLRPVLMTALTTLFGLIPLAMSAFTVANAYIDSLAVAVIGGLTTSTLFTLLALPVWYTAIEDAGSLAIRMLPRKLRRDSWAGPKSGVLVTRS